MRVCVNACVACMHLSVRAAVSPTRACALTCVRKQTARKRLLVAAAAARLFVCLSVCLFVCLPVRLLLHAEIAEAIRSATQPAAAWASPAEQTAECSIEAAMPASRLPCGSPPPLQRAACGAQHTRLRRRCPSTLCASLAAAQPKPCARAPMHARTRNKLCANERPPRMPRRLRDSD